jgi:glycosyltransferase involved in cell wall biosynthesis
MLEPWAWRHKWWKKWPYFHLIEKRHLQRARCLLATAPTEAERLHRMFPTQRIESLPLGLTGGAAPEYESARRTLGWSSDERVLLFLSRIHVKKGLDLLLRALTQTDAARAARLIIVGGGDERTVRELRAFAKTHAASLPSVEWIGEVWGEAKWKFFQGADLFCLPTRSENFGLAVLEALQVGTPVLTTRATPWVEVIGGIRGWIAEPRVEDLHKSLVEFFATPRLTTSQRAEIARSTTAKFNWDTLIPRYVEFYHSLLQPS